MQYEKKLQENLYTTHFNSQTVQKCYRKNTYSTSHQLPIPFHCKEKIFIKKAINNK